MFYPYGSAGSRPFPFNPERMYKGGHPERVFCNSLLVPVMNANKCVKGSKTSRFPKQVLDKQQEEYYTWHEMFQLFNVSHSLETILNIGSGVGVCIFLFFTLPTCTLPNPSPSHFMPHNKLNIIHFYILVLCAIAVVFFPTICFQGQTLGGIPWIFQFFLYYG